MPALPDAGPKARFGFGGRLAAGFPSQVIVDVTEVCNLACLHCPHPVFKHSEHYAGRNLDPGLAARAVAEVRAHRETTQYMRFTANGEPLVHPGLFEMLAHAVSESGVQITLTSNGTLLDLSRADRLLDTNLHLVDISIDAVTPDTYARVRQHGRLEVTRANVLLLIRRRNARGAATRIVVSYVEQPENVSETARFETFWTEAGADRVVVRRLHSNAGASEHIARDMHEVKTQLPRYPCLYPWERIMLTAGGQLAFCPQDWVHGSVLADYRDTSIAAVWAGEEYRKLREAHRACDFGAHAFCGRCPDWRTTRWPHQEGRAYADLVSDLKKP